mgnify:FL=1
METYTARQKRASDAQRQSHLINDWYDTQKPAMEKIADATLDLLHALDMARLDLMMAADVAKVDAFACDVSGQALDLLSDLIGTQQRKLGECGGREDSLHLELSALNDEHKGWAVRWAFRKPVQS